MANLSKVAELARRIYKDEADKIITHYIPIIRDGNTKPTPIKSGETYFRIWLCEMWLPHERELWKSHYPAVQTTVHLQYGDQKIVTFNRVVQPPEDQVKVKGRFEKYLLTHTTPFKGGTIELESVLLKMEGENYLSTALNVLEDFSGLIGPGFAAGLAVAEKVSNGMDKLLEATNGKALLAYHSTFQGEGQTEKPLEESYLAIILATEGEVTKERLSVEDERLSYSAQPGDEAEEFKSHNYMLLKFEAVDRRDDLKEIQSIKDAYAQYWAAYDEYDDSNAADAALKATRRSIRATIRRSPAVTELDGRAAWMDIKQELDQAEEELRGLGAVADSERRDLTEIVEFWGTSIDNAKELGPLGPEYD